MEYNTLVNCYIGAKKNAEKLNIHTAVCREGNRYFLITSRTCIKYRKSLNQIVIEFIPLSLEGINLE